MDNAIARGTDICVCYLLYDNYDFLIQAAKVSLLADLLWAYCCGQPLAEVVTP